MDAEKKQLIFDLYQKYGNIWKVGLEVNLTGQKVHSYLTKYGLINKMNYFTQKDKDFLLENYVKYASQNKLSEISILLKRTPSFISRKAKELGLTNKTKKFVSEEQKLKVSERIKKYIKENGHPKGMINKKHSEKTKIKLSEKSKLAWKNPNYILHSEEYKQKISDRMAKQQASGKMANNYSKAKNGTVTLNDKTYFYRSSWEVNIAAYLVFQKDNKMILDWEYEPDVFWFDNIKRGVRSYKPDFKITRLDGTQYYIEVKGWMDNKSKTKLNRMRIYYPEIEIELIDQKRYNSIKKNSALYKYWGALDNDEYVTKFIKCSIAGCENKNHSKDVCRKHFYKIYKA